MEVKKSGGVYVIGNVDLVNFGDMMVFFGLDLYYLLEFFIKVLM